MTALCSIHRGQKIIGVARLCPPYRRSAKSTAVYVLDEFRLRGFARSVMKLLIEECGRNETLYMHFKDRTG